MAARTRRPFHNEKTIEKIRSSQLINRLIDHVNTDGGILNASQVTAALGLIKKIVPDLAHNTGEVTHTLVDDLSERLMTAKQNAETSRKSLN